VTSRRFATFLATLADDISNPVPVGRDVIVARMRTVLSDMDLVRRALLVTEEDFYDAFSSLPMKEIQKLYDGPLMAGDRPSMDDLWGQFTYARGQIQDEAPESDPEFDEWVKQLRSMMDTLGL